MSAERLKTDELQKLRAMDFSKRPGFEKAEDVLAREVGAAGSPERAEFGGRSGIPDVYVPDGYFDLHFLV